MLKIQIQIQNTKPLKMGFTSTSLRKCFTDGTQLTRGARGDYGFDIMIYKFLMVTEPSQSDFDKLAQRLKVVILEQTDEQLHQSYLDKKYRELLGEGFEWVRTTKDFDMFGK